MTKHTRWTSDQSLRCLHEESAGFISTKRARGEAFDQTGCGVWADLCHLSVQEQRCSIWSQNEPRHEKTCFLHMRKQSRRSAAQRPRFRYINSIIPPLPKSEISSFYM